MSYWRKIIIGLVLMLAVFFGSTVVEAASGINRKINFQGKVINLDGTNVTDSSYDFKFSLWTQASVGTSIWSEVWNSGNSQVGVSSGIFNVQLGTYSTFPPAVDFNSDNLYLSVNFDGDGEMDPRIRMTAVPYAFNAERVGGLTVTNTTGVLTIGDSKTITFGDNFTTTAVGITLDQSLATTDGVTFARLSIGSSVNITTNLAVGGSVAFSGLPIGTGTTVLYIGAGGNLVAGTLPAGGSVYTATNGLNLNGSAFGLGGTLGQNTNLNLTTFSLNVFGVNNTKAMFIDSSGNIGLGTTNPLIQLDVRRVGAFAQMGVAQSTSYLTYFADDVWGPAMYWAAGQAMRFGPSSATLYDPTGFVEIMRIGVTGVGVSGNVSLLGSVSIGTSLGVTSNLTVGGSVTFTNTPIGAGTTILYINASGNLVAGTLPPGGTAYTATNGLNLAGSVFGLGGSLSQLTKIDQNNNNFNLFGTGRIGIGNTDPNYRLDVTGDANVTTSLSVGSSVVFSGLTVGSGTTILYINASGNLIAGTLPAGGTPYTATNGLNLNGSAFGLGGTLTGNTNIGVSSFNFSLVGLPIGTGSTILYINASGNLIAGTLPAGGTPYTATNGLNLAGSVFGLGGTLTENTKIGMSSFSLTFVGMGGTQSLYVGATGYVGIGTTDPRYQLVIPGQAENSGDNEGMLLGTVTRVFENTSNASFIQNVGGAGFMLSSYAQVFGDLYVGVVDSFSTLYIASNNATGLFLGHSGIDVGTMSKFGIGNTNPTQQLDVTGSVNIGGSLTVGAKLSVGGSLSLTGLVLGTGTSILFIDSSGNVVQGTLPTTNIANSKVIVISPEYPGASLSADGSGTTSVAMTSDNTGSGSGWKNYYQLTSMEASLQDYSVIVRITLPSDFDTWETGSTPGTYALELAYQTGLAATTNNAISYLVSNDTDTPGTAVCTIGSTASSSWGSSGCTEAVLNDGGAPEWDAAGETAVVRIKMAANNTGSALVRAGDIILRYKSKF